LHGYSLGFKFTFACKTLDDKNWAVDFGGLKPLKKWLEDNFDHKVVLDENDPKLHHFHVLEDAELCKLVIMDGVGAEMFAKHAFEFADKLIQEATNKRCWVYEVECSEHGANSAIYNRQ
jgi:6-pyruvoyltetrahydropterin/6-carboxytetrahydropterin synthase